jgi:X-X-X-Leu-X-X-Gly heptad repeat protein
MHENSLLVKQGCDRDDRQHAAVSGGGWAMTDDLRSLAAGLDRLAAGASRLTDRLRQLENVDGSVVARILRGELLQLDQAADIAECSDEEIRKQCELTAGTKRPLGVKIAGRWMVGKLELLGDLEQGRIDRRRGSHVRQHAEERAKKYEGWARPQEPLAMAAHAAPDRFEAPSSAAQHGALS